MDKLDNFTNCLNVLKEADFAFADENEIYREPAFVALEQTLREKLAETEGEL